MIGRLVHASTGHWKQNRSTGTTLEPCPDALPSHAHYLSIVNDSLWCLKPHNVLQQVKLTRMEIGCRDGRFGDEGSAGQVTQSHQVPIEKLAADIWETCTECTLW